MGKRLQHVKVVILVCKGGGDTGWGHWSRVCSIYHGLIGRTPDLRIYLVVENTNGSNLPFFDSLDSAEIHDCELAFPVMEALAAKISNKPCQVVIDHPTLSCEEIRWVYEKFDSLVLFYTSLRSYYPPGIIKTLVCPRPILPNELVHFAGQVLAGVEYTPLHPAFYTEIESRRALQSNLYVCFGGARQLKHIFVIIEQLNAIGYRGHVSIAIPEQCMEVEKQLRNASFTCSVICGETPDVLVSEIDKSGLAIVSAGTVFRECIARGLVCGVVEIAKDQSGLSSLFVEADLAISVSLERSDSLEKFFDNALGESRKIRHAISKLDFRAGLDKLMDSIIIR